MHAIGVDARWSQHLVLLREVAGTGRMLPIWIAASDAEQMERARLHQVAARPGTHMLIGDVLGALGRRLDRVRITALRGSVFHAELELDDGVRVDARASDAVTLALTFDVPIDVAEPVFDQGSVSSDEVLAVGDRAGDLGGPGGAGSPAGDPDDDQARDIERFRRFLDEAAPEDFDPD